MLARYHTPIQFDRQSTLVTEMDWGIILFSEQVYLKVPKYVSRESSWIPKHVSSFALIPLLFIIIKFFFITSLCL